MNPKGLTCFTLSDTDDDGDDNDGGSDCSCMGISRGLGTTSSVGVHIMLVGMVFVYISREFLSFECRVSMSTVKRLSRISSWRFNDGYDGIFIPFKC
jgi:hypothetical protein